MRSKAKFGVELMLTMIGLGIGVQGRAVAAAPEPPPAETDPATGGVQPSGNSAQPAAPASPQAEIQAPSTPLPRPPEDLPPANLGDVFTAHGCEAEDVVCLDGDGNGLRETGDKRDRLPPNLDQGQNLTIKVVGCGARYDKVEFTIALEAGRQSEQLFRAEFAGSDAAGREKVQPDVVTACRQPNDFTALHAVALEVPSAAAVKLVFERKAAESPPLVGVQQTHEARVLRPLYFLDISVAAPIILGGKRKISTRLVPDLDASVLTLDEDLRVSPALMLHVFPGGRRLGAISSFGPDRACEEMEEVKAAKARGDIEEKDKKEAERCNHRRRARYAANSLGIQLGVGLDLSKFGDEFYAGLFFEPVVGLNIGVGMAIIKGDQLESDYALGQVVDPAQLGDYTRERYMLRPYIGMSLSFDIIRNVQAAAKLPGVTKLSNK